MANVLKERGHRIVFVIDESFTGVLEAKGFEERLMRMAPPGGDADTDADPGGGRARPEENADPAAVPWAGFIRVTARESRKPTVEQIETVTKPIWEALVS